MMPTAVVMCHMVMLLVTKGAVAADGHRQLQFAMFASPGMRDESCALVERDGWQKGRERRFPGYLNEYGCNVSLTIADYEASFDFCYQSGINVFMMPAEASFECFVQKRNNDYVFLTHISKTAHEDSQIMCYFSCISR